MPDASNKKVKAHLLQSVSGFFEARQMAALVSVCEWYSILGHWGWCTAVCSKLLRRGEGPQSWGKHTIIISGITIISSMSCVHRMHA